MDEKDAHTLDKPILATADLELHEEDAENIAGGRELTKKGAKRLKTYPTCPGGNENDPLCTPLTEDARYISIREHGFSDPVSGG